MGKSILMIHGVGCGGDVWSRMRSDFEAAGWRCESPTLYQHLRTVEAPPPEGLPELCLSDYVRASADYAKQLEQEEGAPPVVIGHSMGGLIAQNLATSNLVSAAVFLTPAGPHDCASASLAQVITFANIIFTSEQKRRTNAYKVWKTGFMWGVLNCVPKDQRQEIFDQARFDSGQVYQDLTHLENAAGGVGVIDESQINIPTLTIGAGKDRATPAKMVRKIADKYADAATPGEFKEYPNNAHWILDEPGVDIVSRDILAWLDEKLGAKS